MDWNIVGVALLLTLSGLYFLETERARAREQKITVRALEPARNAVERAWLAEPLQVFMTQLQLARQSRSNLWPMDKGRHYSTFSLSSTEELEEWCDRKT